MKIKTYLINLKESTERKKTVLQHISGYSMLDVEIVEAVNGKKLSEQEKDLLFDRKRFIRNNAREPLAGEIGCTLSHRKCYRRLLKSDNEYALILEDDVRFVYPDDVELVLSKAIDMLSSHQKSIITLTQSSYICYFPKIRLVLKDYSFYRIWGTYGTCAYLINRQAAKKLLSVDKPFILADDFEYMHLNGIYLQAIFPPLALGDSTVGVTSSEISDRKKIKEIKRPFWYKVKYSLLARFRNRLVLCKILKIKYL